MKLANYSTSKDYEYLTELMTHNPVICIFPQNLSGVVFRLPNRIKLKGFGLRLTYGKDNKPNGFKVTPYDKLSSSQIKFNVDNKNDIIAELVYLAEKYIDGDMFYCRECAQSCKSSIDDRPRGCDLFIEK